MPAQFPRNNFHSFSNGAVGELRRLQLIRYSNPRNFVASNSG
jgi:hypothetical protein